MPEVVLNAPTTDPQILPTSSLPVNLPETPFNPVSAKILTSTRLKTAPLSNVTNVTFWGKNKKT